MTADSDIAFPRSANNGKMIAAASFSFLIGIAYLGAFSRFTHGRYTPSFYRYQLDRAPDDELTRYIPFVDIALATLLIFPQTRTLAAWMCTLFQSIGVGLRIKDGKSPVTDAALASIAAFAAVTSKWM